MYNMLDVESMLDLTEDFREDLPLDDRITKQMAKTVFPFQYIIDDRSMELYVFRFNPSSGKIHVHNLDEQWDKLNETKYVYAATFTHHINKLVSKIIKAAK